MPLENGAQALRYLPHLPSYSTEAVEQRKIFVIFPFSQISGSASYEPGFNLSLLEDGSFVATAANPSRPPPTTTSSPVTSSSSPPATTTSSSPILPVKTISELSAATGLPSSEIQSWAASLPAGSTVRVTHHFDVKKAALAAAAAAAAAARVCNGNPPNHMDFIRHLPQHPAALVNLPITTAATSSALTAATASAADAGLPPEWHTPTDLESFAVDPNEVLKKDCVSVKEEPLEESSPSFACQPGMFGDTYDMSLQGQIKSEPNSPMSSSSSSLVSLVSQYGAGNASDLSDCGGGGGGTPYDQLSSSPSAAGAALSRFPLPHFQRPQHGLPRGVGAVGTSGGPQLEGDVLDLVMPPVDYEAMEEDIDLTGVHLNEQDFHSIKSIVEQTFRDGRDMLDIIGAV